MLPAAKKLLPVLLLLLAAIPSHAHWQLLPAKETKARQQIFFSASYNYNYGLEGKARPCSLGYSFSLAPCFFSLAVQAAGLLRDTSCSASYLPLLLYRDSHIWKLGVDSRYHYQHYEGIYGEHDLICRGFLLLEADTGLYAAFKSGLAWKRANIYVLSEPVTNFYPSFSFSLGKKWPAGFELYAATGTNSDFRYPLFFSPNLTLGSAVTIRNFFRPAIEWSLGCTDFFAASLYINHMAVSLSGRFML